MPECWRWPVVDGPIAARQADDGAISFQLCRSAQRGFCASHPVHEPYAASRLLSDHESYVGPKETEDGLSEAIPGSQGSPCTLGGAISELHCIITSDQRHPANSTPRWQSSKSEAAAYTYNRCQAPKLLDKAAFVKNKALVPCAFPASSSGVEYPIIVYASWDIYLPLQTSIARTSVACSVASSSARARFPATLYSPGSKCPTPRTYAPCSITASSTESRLSAPVSTSDAKCRA
ncbi:hypothetical protein ASPCADRAFT_7033 [Aspergillus carbonarius ITEM 5010]|uniref:Uncharacterized protein n=1 Tax=Aspergillus carbonarius (strain ITEM 5010) TaxID=602072 RepID=A0A1R3RIQ0_ASPC5|nr:hypothetical protein ASPCADRAFT_7033 [Aspergillus carbonarius ITEM 5010]